MLPNMPATIFDSPTAPPDASPLELLSVFPPPFELPSLGEPEEPPCPPVLMPMVMRLAMSNPWSSMESGYSESVSSSTLAM